MTDYHSSSPPMQSLDIKLRPYQLEAIEQVETNWNQWQKELLVMATGTGKTVTAREIARGRLAYGNVLMIAHRDELIEQARHAFSDAGMGQIGKIKAGTTDIQPMTVGSVQTLINRPHYDFDTLIVDEAHHAVSESYKHVLNQYPNAKVLGLTATPDRAGLGDVFDGIAYEYGIRQAVTDGYLSPLMARTIPLDIDMTQCKVRVGDYEVTSIAETLEPYLPKIAESIAKYAQDRKTIVFLPLVAIAQQFRDVLIDHGVEAREVNGASEDRKQTLEWFQNAPKGTALCNAMLLTEGVDIPTCDCIVVLRPTKSRSLYTQMIGRGTRLAPDKKNCLILDFLWLTTKHDLCRPASLISSNAADVDKVSQSATEGELELFGALTDAEESRRESLAEALSAQKKKKARLVDPLQYFVSVGDMALTDYTPEFDWEYAALSPKQEKLITGAGINPENMTRGQASKIIDNIMNRRKQKLSTAKQIRTLEKFGYKNVDRWSMDEASKKMSELAAVGFKKWRLKIKPEEFRWK